MNVGTKRIVTFAVQDSDHHVVKPERTYIMSRRLVAGRSMKLPSNVLHDEYLARTDKWKGEGQHSFPMLKDVYPAWAREILVYPEMNGTFITRKNVVDSQTGWIFMAEYLRAPYVHEDIFLPGIGLFVDPAVVMEDANRVLVIPKSITVLHQFLQVCGAFGKVDDATGMPLAVETRMESQKRWLYRIDGIGVRPMSRDCSPGRHRCIDTLHYGAGYALGVLGEVEDPAAADGGR